VLTASKPSYDTCGFSKQCVFSNSFHGDNIVLMVTV